MAGDTSGQAGARAPISVIRYANGQVDDVAISGDLFRLEQMDKTVWWSAIYRGAQRTCFWFRYDRKRREIVVTISEDEIGCHDDSKQAEEVATCHD